MRTFEATLITTHVDLEGDKFAVEGLESFVASINANYLPVMVEHDIRNAPIGRIASAKIVPLDDGEFAVKGTLEIFESGDTVASLRGYGRTIRITCEEIPTFNVEYDRGLETPEDRELLEALNRLSPESHATSQIKKSIGPIPTLVIAATIVGTAIATGFFGRLGEDLYEGLKNVLKAHFRSGKDRREIILDFQFTLRRHDKPIEIHILITNPTPNEIQELFSTGFRTIDSYLSACNEMCSVSKIVLDYRKGQVKCLYAVRPECIPMILRRGKGDTNRQNT